MRRARPVLLGVAAALACVSLTSCGGSPDAGAGAPAAQAPSQRVSGNPATWPLTGLAVNGSASSVQKRPVLVLKMDNTASSSPQRGLSGADLVVEELVEGGITRLAAFYDSTIPGVVGPVRSMRASDIGIVSPVHGTMVTSGAAAVTLSRLKQADVPWVTEGSPGFFRDDARAAPYNLMTTLTSVAGAVHQAPARPVDYLPWGSESQLPQGVPARRLAATFSGGHTTDWTYRDGQYVNDNSYAAAADQFPADSVLVLRVKVGDAGYRDPAGNPVPETDFTGDGDAMLFHAGRLVRGTWHKDALGSPVRLTSGGHDLTVPAGHTWIELVPADGGGVSFRR